MSQTVNKPGLTGIVALLVAGSVALLSCGGGSSSANGSSPGNPSTPGQAQGVYLGNTSRGPTFDAIVLPNDVFYDVYGNVVDTILYVCGMATGQGTSNSGNYTASENDFDYCNGHLQVHSGNVTATYTTGVSMYGSISENGNTQTFSADVPPSTQFYFDTAADTYGITGCWRGSLTDGEPATVTIDSLGNMNGASGGGCSFSGKFTPDSSNKDFFDVSITLGGSPCMFPNQSASGIGIAYLRSDKASTQIIAAVSSGNSFGIVFAGQGVGVCAKDTAIDNPSALLGQTRPGARRR
jgi:hypothetical protein